MGGPAGRLDPGPRRQVPAQEEDLLQEEEDDAASDEGWKENLWEEVAAGVCPGAPLSPVWRTKTHGVAPRLRRPPAHWAGSKLGGNRRTCFHRQLEGSTVLTWSTMQFLLAPDAN